MTVLRPAVLQPVWRTKHPSWHDSHFSSSISSRSACLQLSHLRRVFSILSFSRLFLILRHCCSKFAPSSWWRRGSAAGLTGSQSLGWRSRVRRMETIRHRCWQSSTWSPRRLYRWWYWGSGCWVLQGHHYRHCTWPLWWSGQRCANFGFLRKGWIELNKLGNQDWLNCRLSSQRGIGKSMRKSLSTKPTFWRVISWFSVARD